jgi:D-lactate dehydrogenase (cytochrome)
MAEIVHLEDPEVPPLANPIEEFEDHLRDASHFKGHADAIYLPRSEEEVAFLLRKAQKESIPVTVSGAGTGLTGARVPLSGWILCTERMNRTLTIEWDPIRSEGTATVEPGVSLKALEKALTAAHLFYPPDPGEKAASIGGTIATNASGPRSFRYGPTRRFVQRLRVVLPTGEVLDIRRGEVKPSGGVFRLRTSAGSDLTIPIPTYPCPTLKKNSAGYCAHPEMDLIDLFIGAEGTLGVVTLAEIRLVKKPEVILSGMLFFDSEEACFQFAMEARASAMAHARGSEGPLNPCAIEFFDSHSLALLAERYRDTPQPAQAALLFEQECEPHEVDHLRHEWAHRAELAGARASDCWYAHKQEDLLIFRKYRYDLPVLVNERARQNGFQKLGTDLAVPQEHGEEMFRFYRSILSDSEVAYAIWGHLGDHHLHVNLLPKSEEEFRKAKELYASMARKAIELGGTVSGEHGIGKVRIPYLEMMVGLQGLKEMAKTKKALDPNGILNRGNIFPEELL